MDGWIERQFNIVYYLRKWIFAINNITNKYNCTEYNQKDCIANGENGHKKASIAIQKRNGENVNR